MNNANSNGYKSTFIVSLGAGLEYYDFVIYGMMIPYLSKLFYPSSVDSVALLKMFSIFAVGYISRPIGGVLFAMLGDKIGRRNVLFYIMLLMAISTLSMGFIPTYADMGLLSTILLVSLRLMQGLSYGAELPGAITIVSENLKPKSKGLHCGIVMSSTAIGATLGSLILFILSSALSESQILAWGWRIPFLIGGVLAVISFYLRFNIPESAYFKSEANKHTSIMSPLKQVLIKHPKKIIIGIILTLFSASLVILNIYFTSHFTTYYAYQPNELYISTIISRLWCVIMLPVFGILSDRFDKHVLMRNTVIIFIFSSLLYMYTDPLANGGFVKLLLLHTVYETFVAAYVACYFPIVAELFGSSVRFTGLAICYNLAYLVAGAIPSLATYMIQQSLSSVIIFVVPIVLGIFACLAIKSISASRVQSILSVATS